MDKFWLCSEGECSGGWLEDGDVEVLWSYVVVVYWDIMLGVCYDFGDGFLCNWLVVGV